ncbi:MAG: chloride channel protein [Bacteroidetes bacterium]|nr:chloride channel protein [Bacteroidota bacterium]
MIDQITEKLKEFYTHIADRNFKKTFLNALPFWLGAFITGIVSVFYAKVFLWAEEGTIYVFKHASWLFFIITPLTFLLSWWLVSKYSPFARGSGIPQVSAAIELSNPKHNYKVRSLLGFRVIVIKVLSSLTMIFGGGIIGREGPTIQISASIFKKINDLLPKWYPKISKRNMIVTGAAAGLASAFNTPLGGIVFAIEELTKTHFNFFKSALLTGVIIAGLTALNFLGPYLYLGYPTLSNIPVWIVFVIIPVAIVSGVAGSGTGRVILFILKRKNLFESNYKKALYAIFAGLIIASLAVFIDGRVFGSGKEIMITTLFTGDKYLEWYIPILRIFGSIVSFSVGASGGIFAPSLSTGASIGAVISGWLHLSGSETNLIILCGMVGSLTGITRSPFTSSILVIEMTNSHNIIFYLMLTALLANLISGLVSRHSFYEYLKDQYIHEIHRSEPQQHIDEHAEDHSDEL